MAGDPAQKAQFEKIYGLACRRLATMKKEPTLLASFEQIATNQPAILWDSQLRRLMAVAALPTEKIPADIARTVTKANITEARQEIRKIGLIALLRDKPFRKALLHLYWRARLFDEIDRYNAEAQAYFQKQQGTQACVTSLKTLAGALEAYGRDHPRPPVAWTTAAEAQNPLVKGGYLKASIEVCPQDGRALELARDPKSSRWIVRCATHGASDAPSPPDGGRDRKIEESNPIVWATQQATTAGN